MDLDPSEKGEVQDEARSQILRQALIRVLESDFIKLQAALQAQQAHLRDLEDFSHALPEDIDRILETIRSMGIEAQRLDALIHELQTELMQPEKLIRHIDPVIGTALLHGVQREPHLFTDAITPIITPAIRNQIRNDRAEMIGALYPIIGQTISRAIGEALQDLAQRIDQQAKRSFNIRRQVDHFFGRIRGISHADLVLREALPYTVENIFLIHRTTGLLLTQISPTKEIEDSDLISGMLTAIREFARDAFGSEEKELEEIQHGDLRVLLRTGQFAYIAVVVQGIEPTGYGEKMQEIIHNLNLEHEDFLHNFSGDVTGMPPFEEMLNQLIEKPSDQPPPKELNKNQKTALAIGGVVILLALVLSVFACIFSIRLMPVAFPPPTVTASVTPTFTCTPSPSPTATYTPTLTATPQPTATSAIISLKAVMTGNVWVRYEPETSSKVYAAPVLMNTPVDVLAVYGEWIKIAWTTEFGAAEGWVPRAWVGFTTPAPVSIITPTR